MSLRCCSVWWALLLALAAPLAGAGADVADTADVAAGADVAATADVVATAGAATAGVVAAAAAAAATAATVDGMSRAARQSALCQPSPRAEQD